MSTETLEIPNYVLQQRIGVGAFAEVWLAEHRHNRRKAAIKILKGTVEAGADAEKLFLREGEVLAGFDQPNIVRIFDNAKIGDRAYLVMEYLAGGTLAERMSQRGIEVGEAIGYVVQIGAALDAAHARGIIHRDLKPANIMLRNATTPVLTDFGASRLLRATTIHGRDGGVIGTPQYMSPEQIRGEPLDGRSDLYALGVLFQELLTGSVPFAGTMTEVVVQHLQAPPPPLPAELAVLQPILNRLLAKDRNQRYGSGIELADALRRCFLDQDALRRLVRVAPSSAWSSQLEALGFALDTQRRAEVRIAQGQHLQPPPAAADPHRTIPLAVLKPAPATAPPPPAVPPLPRPPAPASMPPPLVPPVPAPPPLPAASGSAAAPAVAITTASGERGGLLRTLRVLAWTLMVLGLMVGISGLRSQPQEALSTLSLLLFAQAALHFVVERLARQRGRLLTRIFAWLCLLPAAAGGTAVALLLDGQLDPSRGEAVGVLLVIAVGLGLLQALGLLLLCAPWLAVAGIVAVPVIGAIGGQPNASATLELACQVALWLLCCGIWAALGWRGDVPPRRTRS